MKKMKSKQGLHFRNNNIHGYSRFIITRFLINVTLPNPNRISLTDQDIKIFLGTAIFTDLRRTSSTRSFKAVKAKIQSKT